MENLMEVRPKLKHNSLVIQTEKGLFVKAEEADFQLKGKSIARWITTLWPYMTGEYTLAQLCARLEPAQREHVIHLISSLLQKGVLKNALPEAPGTLPEEVCKQFHAQIEYIDHFVDYPREHFKQFRETSLLLYGSGESLKALVFSLIRNGLRAVSLSIPDASAAYLADLEREVAAVRQGGSEVSLSLVSGAAFETPGVLDGYDGVIYCSDNGSLKDIFLLNQRCVREGRLFLAVTPFAGRMMLGPLVRPGKGPCWLCAMMRLSANSDAHTSAAFWQNIVLGNDLGPQEAAPFLPVARRVGHGLGFELFKALSGCITSDTEQGVIVQNLENLESSLHRLVRHPSCPACSQRDPAITLGQLEEVINRRRDREQTDYEIYEQHQCLLDRRFGVFTRFADEEVEQLPLKSAHIATRYAKSGVSGEREREVIAFSLDTSLSARVQALKKAISDYTSSIPDRRGMILASQEEMAEQGRTTISPQKLATWAGVLSLKSGHRSAWLPAFSLAKNGLVYVPAAAVYPHSSLNSQGIFERTTAGTAVETTFERVLTRGVLSALAYEHLREWVHGRGRAVSIDLASLDVSDPDLHFLLQSARRFEQPFALKEITSHLPLAVVVAHTTDELEHRVATIGLELSGRATLKAALQNLVGELQILESSAQFSDTTIQEDFVASLLATSDLPCSDQKVSRLHEPEVELTQVQQDLQREGRDILFVHTTSADIWEVGTLIAGKVLLTRPAAQAE